MPSLLLHISCKKDYLLLLKKKKKQGEKQKGKIKQTTFFQIICCREQFLWPKLVLTVEKARGAPLPMRDKISASATVHQAGPTRNITCVRTWPPARTLSVLKLSKHVSPRLYTSGGSFILTPLEGRKLDLLIPRACQSA